MHVVTSHRTCCWMTHQRHVYSSASLKLWLPVALPKRSWRRTGVNGVDRGALDFGSRCGVRCMTMACSHRRPAMRNGSIHVIIGAYLSLYKAYVRPNSLFCTSFPAHQLRNIRVLRIPPRMILLLLHRKHREMCAYFVRLGIP